MKQNFTTSELPHVWATQLQESGKAGSFYFRGKTIFSYGYHFPIATVDGDNVLFTKRTYSNTTAKHISKTRGAISHKNIIYCYDVPVNLTYANTEHTNNLNRWKKEIKALFVELGNKRIRNTQDRINGINRFINELQVYCTYFKLPVKDKELKELIKIAAKPEFLEIARQAEEKAAEAKAATMKKAAKAHEQYLNLWREAKDEEISNLPIKVKELCSIYRNNIEAFTHLRYNASQNRVETSKGIQIPTEIAKRAYIQLNGCMAKECKGINVPVMNYAITETGKDYIKAGCHTIPKTDITYIANLLNW
jgi:hypothetical protein